VIQKCFPHLIASPRMAEIVPTYGTDYRKPELAARFNELAETARKQLKLV
jgi:malate dehydrogenase (quinone)